MASNLMMQDCIGLLRKLCPIRRFIHVGDVSKQGLSEYADWTSAPAVFVIPDEERCHTLFPLIEARAGWSTVHAVLAERAIERDYFTASNPRENGLLAPESLAGIWRNIKTLARRRVLATTLDDLLQGFPADVPAVNWLVVNCLPALDVLRGATSCLDHCEVVISRVVLDESISVDSTAMSSGLDAYLAARGFRRLSVHEERHPAIGSVVYVRDWQGLLLEYYRLTRALRVSADRQAEQVEKIATLQEAARERADSSELAADFQRQSGELSLVRLQVGELTVARDRLARELATQLQMSVDREALIAQVSSHRDEQSRIAGQHATEREQAVRERDEGARSAAELRGRLDELALERDRLAQELAAQRQLSVERDSAIAQLSTDREEQIRLVGQRVTEREQAVRERDEGVRSAAELQRRLDELALERDRLAQELNAQRQFSVEREAAIAQLITDRDEQTRLAGERATEREQAVGERDEGARSAAELQRRLDELALERDRLAQELNAQRQLSVEREATIAQLSTARDEQARVAEQREKEQAQAISDRDTQAGLARELETTVEQHSRAAEQAAERLAQGTERISALSGELDARAQKIAELQSSLEKLDGSRQEALAELLEARTELGRSSATAQECASRITKLEGDRAELQSRHLLLDRELLKAEAQIDLIKDVILRDKAF
jgi:hypothetical protein